ncbi:MAG: nuclear transport factor 2 family protein [Betaproteobacteria bacterium]
MSTPAKDRSIAEVIDTYCAVWDSACDPARRRTLLQSVWAEGATYTDPTVQAIGLEQLLAHVDTVLTRRPGSKVTRTSQLDEHHGLVRFGWRVVQADGSMLPEGIDLAEISGGNITRIVGFFGPLRKLEPGPA